MLVLLFGLMSAQPIAAVPMVYGDSSGLTPDELYTAVDDATRERMSLRMLTREEVFVASREGLAERLRDCGPNVSCLASRLRTFDASLGLLMVLNADLNPPLLSLRLLDTDGRRQVATKALELRSNSKRELPRIQAAVAEMLEQAGFSPTARVTVELDPPQANLQWKDGRAADKGSSNVFTVPPGTYTLQAQHDGHQPVTQEISVVPGQESTVSLRLPEESSILQSPWLWLGIGAVAVAATGVGVYAATRDSSRGLCVFRSDVGSAGCN